MESEMFGGDEQVRDQVLESWLTERKIEWEFAENIELSAIQIEESHIRNIRMSSVNAKDLVNQDVVESYAQNMLLRGVQSFPPIVIVRSGAVWHVVNGVHRVYAMRKAHVQRCAAYVVGVEDPVVLDRLRRTFNVLNGLRPTNEELLQQGQEMVLNRGYSVVDAAKELSIRKSHLEAHVRGIRTRNILKTEGLDLSKLTVPKSFFSLASCIKDPLILKRVTQLAHAAGLGAEQAKDFIHEVYIAVNDAERLKVLEAWEMRFKEEIQRRAGGIIRSPMPPVVALQVQLGKTDRAIARVVEGKPLQMSVKGVDQVLKEVEQTMANLKVFTGFMRKVRLRA